MEYIIKINWDSEAGVWIATSDDIRGLVLESGSIDALMERVRYAVPDLLQENNQIPHNQTTLHFCKARHTANAIMKQSGIDHKF